MTSVWPLLSHNDHGIQRPPERRVAAVPWSDAFAPGSDRPKHGCHMYTIYIIMHIQCIYYIHITSYITSYITIIINNLYSDIWWHCMYGNIWLCLIMYVEVQYIYTYSQSICRHFPPKAAQASLYKVFQIRCLELLTWPWWTAVVGLSVVFCSRFPYSRPKFDTPLWPSDISRLASWMTAAIFCASEWTTQNQIVKIQ